LKKTENASEAGSVIQLVPPLKRMLHLAARHLVRRWHDEQQTHPMADDRADCSHAMPQIEQPQQFGTTST
jgi:hypothetical protein